MAAPQDPPETPPEAAPVAEPAPGPWAADAAEFFGDNQEAITAFDRYMREKVQPRITQLEDSPAQKLYKSLQSEEAAAETTVGILAQTFGEDFAEEVVDAWNKRFEAEPVAPAPEVRYENQPLAEPAEPAEPTQADDPRLTWAEQQMAKEADEEERRAAEELLDQVIAEPEFNLTPADRVPIQAFMQLNETVGEAVTAYHQYKKDVLAAAGAAPAPEEPAPEEPAPPTLGSAGSPAATPPVERKQGGWDDLENELRGYQREQAVKRQGTPAVAPPTL